MKSITLKVLLLGGLFFVISMSAHAKKILSDVFVFKIANEVYSLRDLKSHYQGMLNLNCVYPDSLLYMIFKQEFSKESKKNFVYSKKFTSSQKLYFNSVLTFYKLLIYSKSYEINIKDSLERYFYLSSRQNNCSEEMFNGKKKFTSEFKEIMSLEIFIRSRFLPTEIQGKSTPVDIQKAVKSAKDLVKSIDKQISEEVYW